MINDETLDSLIRENSSLSDEEIAKSLGYASPKIEESDKELLLKFISNLESPVFLFQLPGILSGALGSRHSRLKGDIRNVISKMLKEKPEIRAAFDSLNLPDFIGQIGDDYFKRVYAAYGDDSVAQIVPLAAGFEGVSMFHAMNIFHHRLLAGIEKSSRYIEFDAKIGGQYNYVVDPLIIKKELEKDFREVMDSLFDTYSDYLHEEGKAGEVFRKHLTTHVLPFDTFSEKVKEAAKSKDWQLPNEGEFKEAYIKTIRAMHLDNVRHILPLASRTLLSVEGNAQNIRDLLIAGYSIPTGESIAIAELLRREAGKHIGSLVEDINPLTERGSQYVNFRAGTNAVGRNISVDSIWKSYNESEKSKDFPEFDVRRNAEGNSFLITDKRFGFVSEISSGNSLDEIVAAVISERNPVSFRSSMAHVSGKMSQEEKEYLVLAYAGISNDLRKNRRHKPGRAFERFTFDINVDCTIGEIRDLRRHRMWTYLDPISYDRILGFFISPLLKDAGLGEELDKVYEKSRNLHSHLSEVINPYVASTGLPLSARFMFSGYHSLRQGFHVDELRTQPGAHINYKRISQMLYLGATKLLPLVEDMMIFVDKETEIDYGRALQEIRAVRKKAG